MTDTTDAHRGQKLRGNATEWSRLRMARNLSISQLAEAAGIPRSLVGLIDQGRLTPTIPQSKALLAVLEADR